MGRICASIAPSKCMYYVWQDKGTIFARGGVTVRNALKATEKFYRLNYPNEENWKFITLPIAIRAAPQSVVEFFCSELHRNVKIEDLHIGLKKFKFNDYQDRQILIDILFCVDDNLFDEKIEYVQNEASEFCSINVQSLDITWTYEFTKRKKDRKIGKTLMSLSISQIKSFVGNSHGLACKLKSGTIVTLGGGDFSQYEKMLRSYSID